MDILNRLKAPIIYIAIGVALSFGVFYYFKKNNPTPPVPDVSYVPEVLGAENPVPLGDIVRLRVIPYKNAPEGFSSFSCMWKIFDGDKEKHVEGSSTDSIIFGTGIEKKTLKVVCAVSQVFKDGSCKIFLIIKDLTIGDAPNPPGPDPIPTPDPTFPDARYKLSKFIYDSGKLVNSPTRRIEANALANSFQSVASAIAAGTIKTPDDALIKCKEANRAALQSVSLESIARWEATFVLLQERLYQLYTDRQINSVSDFADAYRELAVGLREIK